MAHSLLGQIAIFNGRLDEGIALTEREIALNPANAMALYQLGDARVRQAKWDEGIAGTAEIDLAQPGLQRSIHRPRDAPT